MSECVTSEHVSINVCFPILMNFVVKMYFRSQEIVTNLSNSIMRENSMGNNNFTEGKIVNIQVNALAMQLTPLSYIMVH